MRNLRLFSLTAIACAWVLALTLTTTQNVQADGVAPAPARSRFHRHRHPPTQPPAEFDPPEITIGERLFLETRFAEFFARSTGDGDVNTPLATGDPVMDLTITTGDPLPGPFAGESMNCRGCHLVDEQVDGTGAGMRTYADFARRSPVPDRGDGHTTTPRNSPPLVNASLPRPQGLLLHFDGEFASMPDLVRATMTGRNYGWLPRETATAIRHIARVIRGDDGQGVLAGDFGGLSYRTVLTGRDPAIPAEFRLPRPFRIDVARASDREILDAVAALIGAYTEHLEFSADENGHFNLSPFDVFLAVNHLPQAPRANESDLDYSRRLLRRVRQQVQLGSLQFVTTNPNTDSGGFDFHPTQPFVFGAEELRGLTLFLSEPDGRPATVSGNCVACHAAPRFTDFRLHNTGATQIEYDALHGDGAFAGLDVPGLLRRLARPDDFLPPSARHPDASGRFRAVPTALDPSLTDLGIWNVFANPDVLTPQPRLRQMLCDAEFGTDVPTLLVYLLPRCSPIALLPKTIGLFKTANLRDLAHSAPYIHTGQFDTLEDVLAFYRVTAQLQRDGRLRNGADDLAGIRIGAADIAPLAAFLRSLNEDYQ